MKSHYIGYVVVTWMGNVQIWEKCCKHVNMASRRGLYETPDWVKARQCHVDSCFFFADRKQDFGSADDRMLTEE